MNPIARGCRVLATALALAVFGLAAVLLSLTLFPLLALSAADPEQATRRVQAGVHYGCRGFVGFARALNLVSYETSGLERLRAPGRLIVANHPSLVDVIFLFAWLPQLDCIVKQDLCANPVLGSVIRWAGYIGNASPGGLVDSCAAALRAGRTLVVFAEGTRTTPGAPLKLRRGAARIALKAGAEVVPLQIRCQPLMMTKNMKWYEVPERTPHFSFAALPSLRAEGYRRAGEPMGQAARRLTAQFHGLLDLQPQMEEAALPAMLSLQ